MDEAGEADAGDVAARAVDAVKVPDGLGRVGVVLVQETAAVFAGEDTRKAPGRMLKGLDVGDVDD